MPWLASRACLFVVESSHDYLVCLGKERADICGRFTLASVGQYQAGRNGNRCLWSVAITRIHTPITGTGARAAPYSGAAGGNGGGADRVS